MPVGAMNDKPHGKTPKDKRKLGTNVPKPPKKEKKSRKSPKKTNESLGFIIQMKRSF
jgi:hypothetical protein